uniref:Uncharacterized protein n=1 Tax=Anguilla anguilla TaxID=7936 RepID=A0A0E9UZ96_ANGAN
MAYHMLWYKLKTCEGIKRITRNCKSVEDSYMVGKRIF